VISCLRGGNSRVSEATARRVLKLRPGFGVAAADEVDGSGKQHDDPVTSGCQLL
jgi:hypothetical protein